MLVQAYTGKLITPNDFFQQSGQKSDLPLPLQQISTVLTSHGVAVDQRSKLKLAELALILATGRPALLLVKYSVLQQAGLARKHRGDIVDVHGRVLGQHEGIEFYTIGQRKGLGVSAPKPLYVIELDAANNRVVVGDDSALERDRFTVERCNWIPFEAPDGPVDATVKIRYHHRGAPATVTPLGDGRAEVRLQAPQRAITPGQAAVFYQGDLVLGGGWIAA
jgi:hypothetical protein